MNKKTVAVVSVLAVVAIAVAVPFLVSNLNSVVARAIERHGSDVTDTSVRVSGVELSLREGRGSIEGLRVASPDGYGARDAFTLGNITVDIDLGSIGDNPIVIEEIRIQAPVVNAEVTKTGASNVEELRKRAQAYASGKTGGAGEGDGGEAKRFRVKRFVFEEGRIEVDASALGVEKRSVTLPEIRLADVGGAGGATPDQIAKDVLSAVARRVTAEIASSEVDRMIKDKLSGSVADKAKGLLDKISK